MIPLNLRWNMLALQNPEGNLRGRQISSAFASQGQRMRNISAGAASCFFFFPRRSKADTQGYAAEGWRDFVLLVEARSHPLSGRIRCRPSTGCRVEKGSWGEEIRKSERAGWEFFLLCSITRLSSPLVPPKHGFWEGTRLPHKSTYPCILAHTLFIFFFFLEFIYLSQHALWPTLELLALQQSLYQLF